MEAGAVTTTLSEELLKYGLVGVLALVFAFVINFLYKEARVERRSMEGERKVWAQQEERAKGELLKEREACRVEKESIRYEYEKKHREILEGYTHAVQQLNVDTRTREDVTRREYLVMIERLSASAEKGTDELVKVLQKVHEKITR